MVRKLFRKLGWQLREADSWRDAAVALNRSRVHVVIADAALPEWPWKSVLEDLRERAPSAQLVVASRHADESLWSQVLNEGGYDVMAQPLDAHEVERVVASVHRHNNYRAIGAGA